MPCMPANQGFLHHGAAARMCRDIASCYPVGLQFGLQSPYEGLRPRSRPIEAVRERLCGPGLAAAGPTGTAAAGRNVRGQDAPKWRDHRRGSSTHSAIASFWQQMPKGSAAGRTTVLAASAKTTTATHRTVAEMGSPDR